jgi:GTP cyclohydrolase I
MTNWAQVVHPPRPQDIVVAIEASHCCLPSRGVRRPGADLATKLAYLRDRADARNSSSVGTDVER